MLDSEKARMAGAVAFVDDLFFATRIQEVARKIGVSLRVVVSAAGLREEVASESPALLLVDLHAKQAPIETLEKFRAQDNRACIVAFYSHVDTQLAGRARAAGADEVLPRSKFTQRLAELLETAKPVS